MSLKMMRLLQILMWLIKIFLALKRFNPLLDRNSGLISVLALIFGQLCLAHELMYETFSIVVNKHFMHNLIVNTSWIELKSDLRDDFPINIVLVNDPIQVNLLNRVKESLYLAKEVELDRIAH